MWLVTTALRRPITVLVLVIRRDADGSPCH